MRYLIVGQGLAGSFLAFHLHRAGHTVKLIDKNSGAGSSRVAAGIYHPLVFKRTSLTWKSDILFSLLEVKYPEIELILNAKFYHPTPYYRYFASAAERDTWIKYRPRPEYNSFLGADRDDSPYPGVKSTFGVGEVLRSGWVNTNILLDSFKLYFTDNNILELGQLNYNNIELGQEGVSYNSFEADKVIFAEGYGIKQNPWFSYLPLSATKGQVLTITAQSLPTDSIVNRKVFVMPLGANQYKVGSTYEWQWEHENPTEPIKADLVTKLEALVDVPYTVAEHRAGIRPSVVGRRPLVGIHPKYPQLAVFNGMGSKGVMLLPYLTDNFVAFLEGREEIEPEADIHRFADLYSL